MSTHGGITKTHKATPMDDTTFKWIGGIVAIVVAKVFGIFGWIMHRQVKRVDAIEKESIKQTEKNINYEKHMERQDDINDRLGETLAGLKTDSALICQHLKIKKS